MLKGQNSFLQPGRLLIGVVFLFILQGCTTPFVNVEVGKDICAKSTNGSGSGSDGPIAGCDTTDVVTTISHDGLTCQPGGGSHICNPENAKCNRSGSKRCDTIQVNGTQCGCICTSTPD